MNNTVNNLGLFYPSNEIEKQTRAFNKYIWFYVSLMSMLPVALLVIFFIMLYSIWDIVNNTFYNISIALILIPVVFSVVLIFQGVQSLTPLITSYKFENSRITRGILQGTASTSGLDIAIDTAIIAGTLANASSVAGLHAGSTALRMRDIKKRSRLNRNPAFVTHYFDTDLYKKKVYENPQLVKVTRYSIVYKCDNNKKLVIPRIYEGMENITGQKKASLIGRILIRVLLVLGIVFCVQSVGLAISLTQNSTHVSNIAETQSTIERNLSNYGYTVEKVNEKIYRFTKETGSKTSKISYHFDKNGNVKDVELQLYYDPASENVEHVIEELTYILQSANYPFSNNQIGGFLEMVEENFAGNKEYGNIKSGKKKLTLGASEGYMDIHSY